MKIVGSITVKRVKEIPGIEGMINRVTEWNTNIEYHNDAALTTGIRFLDYAIITTTTGYTAYQCLVTHTSSESNKPANTNYWKVINSLLPIFTPVILADNGVIRLLQSNQLLIQNDENTVTAGLSGAGSGSSGYRIWAGAVNPSAAPFSVNELGYVKMVDALVQGIFRTADSGSRIEITDKNVMTLYDYDNNVKIQLDAVNSRITINSTSSGGDYSQDVTQGSTIKIDAETGTVEARSKSNTSRVAYVSPSGIFCNNAETLAVSAIQGTTKKAAIVGLGYGTVNASQWNNENWLAGIYGYASNSGTAPEYGAFIMDLMAAGLLLRRKGINNNSATYTYLSQYESFVLGLNTSEKTVFLPNDGKIGRIIIAKMINTSHMRFMPRSGQHIYDDNSENDYYDIGNGWMGIFIFTIWYVGSTKVEAWSVNTLKY